MKLTIFCLIAFTAACALAASIKLNADAQDIVDAAKPLFNAKKIAKIVRIIASQGENSRKFVASLNDISSAAQACVLAQSQSLEAKMKTKEVTPQNATDFILAGCSQYQSELEPAFTAYKAAIPEMTQGSGTFYNDMPQSVQSLIQNYAKLSQEIQANNAIVKDPATFGPKVKALTDQFRAISDADRQAVIAKLPYMKELLLPTGQYYANITNMLNYLDAKAAGQAYDTTGMEAAGQKLMAYWGQNAEQELNYINDKIDAYQVPAAIAQDGSINKIAAKFGKTGANYAKLLLKQPQFNSVLNKFVTGSFGKMSASASGSAGTAAVATS